MSFSQSQAELEGNAVIPEELCTFGASPGVCSAVSLSEDRRCELRDGSTATAVRKRPPHLFVKRKWLFLWLFLVSLRA